MLIQCCSRALSRQLGRTINTFGRRRRLLSTSLHSDEDSVDLAYDVEHGDFNLVLHPENNVKGTRHIPRRCVPPDILLPPRLKQQSSATSEDIISLGSETEWHLRDAGKLAAEALQYVSKEVRAGVTTDELDKRLHEWIVEHKCYPSPLNYQGSFPKSCCTSVNNIVAHAIPDGRPLEETDMLTIDLTLFTAHGVHADTSRTILLPSADSLAKDLKEITQLALNKAISVCGPGVPFRQIGVAVESVLDKANEGFGGSNRGYSVVRQLTGHGIGRLFHMPPWILHHRNDDSSKMQPGHCFTIEPAIMASPKLENPIFTFLDGWTIATTNGSRAAQAEHTILITDNGADVLTSRKGEDDDRESKETPRSSIFVDALTLGIAGSLLP